jgi:hypothetical protein
VSPSPNPGCSWGFVPVAGATDGGPLLSVKDVAVRPAAPHSIVALRSAYDGDGGVTSYATQVYQSTDDGAHWAALGVPIDPTVDAVTVDVTAGDPHRLYVSAFRETVFADGGSQRTASLFVSLDDGSTWTERPVPLDQTVESAVYIAAVDPSNPDKLWLRSEGQSRLMLTTDAGKTFVVSKPITGNMLGFALSADGSKVWFGSTEDGLLTVTDPATLAYQTLSGIAVHCLGVHGSDLWACSNEPSGFTVGVSHAGATQPDGATAFTPKLHLDSISGPLACPPGSNDAACDFAMLCTTLGGCSAGDAGPGDGGGGDAADGGATSRGGSKSSCGCAIVGGGAGGGALLLALGAAGTVVAAAIARRRARRGRRA